MPKSVDQDSNLEPSGGDRMLYPWSYRQSAASRSCTPIFRQTPDALQLS